MKKLFLAITAAVVLAACNNTKSSEVTETPASETETVSTVNSADAPVMSFETDTYDFGTIVTGEKVTYDFKFKNTGKTPLIISSAQASCGCTVPDYPHTPIAPGEEGLIKVVFDSSGKLGMQNKLVTLTSNANPAVAELHIVGDIKEAK